jgi:hypothetical protein
MESSLCIYSPEAIQGEHYKNEILHTELICSGEENRTPEMVVIGAGFTILLSILYHN